MHQNLKSVVKWLSNHHNLESCLVLTQSQGSEFSYLYMNLLNKDSLTLGIGISKVSKIASVPKELTVQWGKHPGKPKLK